MLGSVISQNYTNPKVIVISAIVGVIPVISSYFGIKTPQTLDFLRGLLSFLDSSSMGSEDKLAEIRRTIKIAVDQFDKIFTESNNEKNSSTPTSNQA